MMPHVCTAWCGLKGEGVHCIPAMLREDYTKDYSILVADFKSHGMEIVKIVAEDDVNPRLCDKLMTHYTDGVKRTANIEHTHPDCNYGYVIFFRGV